jgi:nucleoside-diphosphate-sugar epimerase
MSGARLLVTGASGFIGGHLARELRSLPAVGASRRTPPPDPTITWVGPLDLSDGRALARALDGVEVVVHAAGRAHVLRETTRDPLASFRAANVETTRALAEAAVAAGVRRMILLSSVAVYGEETTDLLTPSTPSRPSTPYGISRKEADEVALEVASASALQVVLLRLPMVYGEGMKGNPLRLFDLVHSGRPVPLGAIRNERSTLYVGNVVFAVRGLLDAQVPPGSIFLPADPGTVSTPQLVREIAEAMGLTSRLLRIPPWVLRASAAVGSAVFGERFPLSPSVLARLSGTLVVDRASLVEAVGAELPFTRHAALRATAAWYRGSRGTLA